MIGDGRSLLNKDEFGHLLRSILPVQRASSRPHRSKAERAIAASAVITQYATGTHGLANNDFARIEAYVMNSCYIWAAAGRLNLPNRSWKDTTMLLEVALDRSVRNIAEEAKDLLTGMMGDPHTEPLVGPLHYPLIGGTLAAHGLWCRLGGSSEWLADSIDDIRKVVAFCCDRSVVASEYFAPAFYLMTEFLRWNGDVKRGEQRFRTLLSLNVLRKISQDDLPPFWHPYVPPEDAARCQLGLPIEQHRKETWEKLSYTAWPIILIAARRGLRQTLSTLWHTITDLTFLEPRPQKEYEALLWRFEGGTMHQHQVTRPCSWSWLQRQANDHPNLQTGLLQNPYWLPYYLLVYPHRFNARSVLALDDALLETD